MASEVSFQTSPRSAVGPVLWAAATALAAATIVTLIAAAWITLRGYPDHAQSLSVPLADINAVAGELEGTDTSVRLIPDDRGVAIVLLDAAPRFPAVQFSQLTLEVVNATTLRDGQALWATRDAPEETRRLPLKRDGSTLSANLAESPDWTDRVNGIGVAFMAQGPVELESVTLRPPEPTVTYVLKRMWHEWSYREGYHGHTINRLRGAGHATLVPVGLAGGFALLVAGGTWLAVTSRSNYRLMRQPGIIAITTTLGLLLASPWIRETYAEAMWSVETYAGKTEAERRLAEPDSHLFELAMQAKKSLPREPQRIWWVEDRTSPPHYGQAERYKLRYYLAPHNTSLLMLQLPQPSTEGVRPGDYILVTGSKHRSFIPRKGVIEPGYPVTILNTFGDNRIFKVQERYDRGH